METPVILPKFFNASLCTIAGKSPKEVDSAASSNDGAPFQDSNEPFVSAHCNFLSRIRVSRVWERNAFGKIKTQNISSLGSSLIRFFSFGATA